MKSKNKPAMTVAEREHVERVKLLSCTCCDAGGGYSAPSEAHEIEQGLWWTSVAWCPSCHRGPKGWHGDKSLLRVRKLDELKCLNETLRRLLA